MARMRRLFARFRSLCCATTGLSMNLAREVASHLALLAEEFERRGMSPQRSAACGETRIRRRGAGEAGSSR